MRNLLLVIASVLSLALGVKFFVMQFTQAHKLEAEFFLSLLGENKPRSAFDSTTSHYQNGRPWKSFSHFIDRYGLEQYQRGSFQVTKGFTTHVVDGGWRITLEGSALQRDGTPFKVSVDLRSENGRWKVDEFGLLPPLPASRPLIVSPPSLTPHGGTDAAFDPQPLTLWQKFASKSKETHLSPLKPPETGADRRNVFPSSSPVDPSPSAAPGSP